MLCSWSTKFVNSGSTAVNISYSLYSTASGSSSSQAPPSADSGAGSPCPICLTEPRNTAFLCGHQLCWDCAQKVDHCPVCRKFVTHRIRLFEWPETFIKTVYVLNTVCVTTIRCYCSNRTHTWLLLETLYCTIIMFHSLLQPETNNCIELSRLILMFCNNNMVYSYSKLLE